MSKEKYPYEEKQNYLVTIEVNYGDEFDMSEFQILDGKSLNKYVEFLQNKKTEFEIYFGTNESHMFSNGQKLLKEFDIKKLTDIQYTVLSEIFGGGFGTAAILDWLSDKMEDEDDEYDEGEGD